MVLPPHHMCHVHQRIVDHDGEVVGGRAVGADDDRIADDVDGKPDVAPHHVLEDDVVVVGHPEANRRPLPAVRRACVCSVDSRPHGQCFAGRPSAAAAWRSSSSWSWNRSSSRPSSLAISSLA